MTKIRQHFIDCVYPGKSALDKLADAVNRKSIYPLWRGHKVVFMKNSLDETDYSLQEYKYTSLAVLFFIVTMPLLALTMAIKYLSHQNKLKFREIKEIDIRKENQAELRKKAKQDALLKKKMNEQAQLIAKKNLEEAKKRVASPVLGRKGSALQLSPFKSNSSSPLSLGVPSDKTKTPSSKHNTPSKTSAETEDVLEIVVEDPVVVDPLVVPEPDDELFSSQATFDDPLPTSADDEMDLEDVEAQAPTDDAEEQDASKPPSLLKTWFQNSPNLSKLAKHLGIQT